MKTVLKSLLYISILLLIVYFSGNYMIKKVTAKAVAELRPRLEQKGIIINHFSYDNVRLTSYNSCLIRNVDLNFYLNKKMYGKESFKASFQCKSISIRFADFSQPSLFFTLKDFSLLVEPDDHLSTKTFGTLKQGYLQSKLPLYIKTPEESAREILDQVKTLFRESKTPFDLIVQTDVELGMDDKVISVGLFTERIDSLTYLKFDAEDIMSAAKQIDVELSVKEAQILSSYPSKVPILIKITRDAKRLSKMEKDKDSEFPEDAFRHIYWSYKLTRELGPQLAKEITDAHETLPGNTDSERAMDFHNNAIGRILASQNLSIQDIRQEVLSNNDIIKFPETMEQN